ncbi:MAG: hypothetical protein C0401_02535 [Anaerolinea sp.]|nr:hypothetical protein [Anaerolinea sp.]
MNESEAQETPLTSPEKVENNKRQIWLILVVMLTSFCVGTSVFLALLWVLFKKIIPPGWF